MQYNQNNTKVKNLFPSNSNLILLAISLLLFSSVTISCNSKDSKDSKGDATNDSVEVNADLGDSLMIIDGDTIKGMAAETEEADTGAPKSSAYIVVDKPNLKLYVIEKNDTLFKGPICAGRNRGNKKGKDDYRTPEGTFKIAKIQDSTNWLYHTNDGRWVPHVYGPWFLRLDADGWQGIGIHGTSAPSQIGQRRSKGCIRMHNEDIKKVHDLAFVGMEVRVLPDVVNWDSSTTKQSSNMSDNTAKETTQENANTSTEETPAVETTPAENPSPAESAPATAPEVSPSPSEPAPEAEPQPKEPTPVAPAPAEPKETPASA